jgi:hypothetical protein
MPRRTPRCVFVVLLGCTAAPSALAQAAYESVFADYRSFRQPPTPLGWPEANRQAGALGGFVGQMRAAPRAPAPADPRPAPPPAPMTDFGEMLSTLRAGDPQ